MVPLVFQKIPIKSFPAAPYLLRSPSVCLPPFLSLSLLLLDLVLYLSNQKFKKKKRRIDKRGQTLSFVFIPPKKDRNTPPPINSPLFSNSTFGNSTVRRSTARALLHSLQYRLTRDPSRIYCEPILLYNLDLQRNCQLQPLCGTCASFVEPDHLQ